MELDSSRVPTLHDWLTQDAISHWSPTMHSVSVVWLRSKPLILENRPKVSCLKGVLTGRISPNVVHDVGQR